MTNRLEVYERYMTAWSPISTSDRAQVLGETVSEGVAYRDAMTHREGAQDLAQHLSFFQERSPGSSFRLLSMLNWGSDALANWQIVDAGGAPGFTGYDALTFAEDGRIASILGFSDTDKQRLR